MEYSQPRCDNCRFWKKILEEGSPGTLKLPSKGDRLNWGECSAAPYSQQLIRVKGILETRETFWCSAYITTHPK